MALKKETIAQIAKILKLKETDITTAITSEAEVELKIDDKLQAFDDTELQTLKSNSYKEGKKAGVEMEVDELKKELGYDFTGKTIKGLIEFNKKEVLKDAKIEPEKKVTELQEKLTTIQKSYKELEDKIVEKDNEVASTKTKTEVFRHIPAFAEDSGFDQEDVYNKMIREGYEYKLENGRTVAYKDGKQVLDKVGNPVEIKDVVNSYVVEKKIVTPEGKGPAGRGAGNGAATSKFGSLSELKKSWGESGKSMLGSEFREALDKAVKDNPEFALDK